MLSLHYHLWCFLPLFCIQDQAHSHLWDKVCPQWLIQATMTFSFSVLDILVMSRRRSNWTTLCKMENVLALKSRQQKRKGADSLLITSGTRDQNLQTLSLPVFHLFLRVYQLLSLTGLPHRAGTEASSSSDLYVLSLSPREQVFGFLNYLFWDIFKYNKCAHLSVPWNQSGQMYTSICTHSLSWVAQWLRIHLPMQETWVRSLIWKDPLEEKMATHSSILAGKIA